MAALGPKAPESTDQSQITVKVVAVHGQGLMHSCVAIRDANSQMATSS